VSLEAIRSQQPASLGVTDSLRIRAFASSRVAIAVTDGFGEEAVLDKAMVVGVF
jgi:hypothetical protein